jgi:hypothetical protein
VQVGAPPLELGPHRTVEDDRAALGEASGEGVARHRRQGTGDATRGIVVVAVDRFPRHYPDLGWR